MMKKDGIPHHNFQSITTAHRALGYADPKHPLVSLINGCTTHIEADMPSGSHVLNFYKISYKPRLSGQLKYGQHYYDFDGGGLLFAAPGQVIGPAVEPVLSTIGVGADDKAGDAGTTEKSVARSRYTLLIHPDFFLGYPLAKKIKQYGFFSYSVHEALHLSDEEAATILSVFAMIDQELESRIDDFSQDVVISQVELMLNFANRFYKRQFITRKAASHDLLTTLEALLNDYFSDESLVRQGVPTVAWLAAQTNLTPSYLSDMLRSLTGFNAQQHIHNQCIEKAKELLSTTQLSVSEVAYALGFEYSQSFNKLFKRKTNLSPLEFRGQFN